MSKTEENKLTVYTKLATKGSWSIYYTTTKACVKIKRTVMVLEQDYTDCYTALRSGDRVAKSLGYNHCIVEGDKHIWRKV